MHTAQQTLFQVSRMGLLCLTNLFNLHESHKRTQPHMPIIQHYSLKVLCTFPINMKHDQMQPCHPGSVNWLHNDSVDGICEFKSTSHRWLPDKRKKKDIARCKVRRLWRKWKNFLVPVANPEICTGNDMRRCPQPDTTTLQQPWSFSTKDKSHIIIQQHSIICATDWRFQVELHGPTQVLHRRKIRCVSISEQHESFLSKCVWGMILPPLF